ncbi:MAG: hypothetical protein EXR72_03745 [Myxococcales bacterium]|nr:hypothetical protein [Myxococcales bacterium]
MRLVRAHVEHFGSIASVDVQFGKHLNVLYGPNDLGKSTLVEALRLALLLPPTFKDHEEWRSWGTLHKPKAELVFQAKDARAGVDEAAERFYWKVH